MLTFSSSQVAAINKRSPFGSVIQECIDEEYELIYYLDYGQNLYFPKSDICGRLIASGYDESIFIEQKTIEEGETHELLFRKLRRGLQYTLSIVGDERTIILFSGQSLDSLFDQIGRKDVFIPPITAHFDFGICSDQEDDALIFNDVEECVPVDDSTPIGAISDA